MRAKTKKKRKPRDPLANVIGAIKKAIALHARTKARINRLFDKWRTRLGLNQWRLDVVWEWNGLQDTDAVASSKASWAYMLGTLTFDLPACTGLDVEQLEEVVIHELLHLVVNEMREDHIDHEERVVSHLTSVMARLG